jgi:hypothetical protein
MPATVLGASDHILRDRKTHTYRERERQREREREGREEGRKKERKNGMGHNPLRHSTSNLRTSHRTPPCKGLTSLQSTTLVPLWGEGHSNNTQSIALPPFLHCACTYFIMKKIMFLTLEDNNNFNLCPLS